MSQKVILSERQHEVIVNHILNEMVDTNENILNEDGSINEGVWEKIKYGLSKLGRYKAGGKIFGKGKIDQEAAAKIQAIIDKKGNEVIKALDAKIKEVNPEFPNNEKGVEFLNTILDISEIYDSIVAATKKQPNEEGYLPIDAANGVINDLREYVKKFLDVDLTAAYSVVDEAEGNTLDISEDELKTLDEARGIKPDDDDDDDNKKTEKDKEEPYDIDSDETADFGAGVKKGYRDNEVDEDEHSDIRDKLQAKRGDSKQNFDSTRMDTLKSNKLPMTLIGVGASLGAFSWLVNTEWFKHLFETVSHTTSTEMINQTIETKSDIFGQIKPGQGVTQLMNSMNNAGLTPNSTPDEFLNQVKILGGGNLNDGINALAEKGGIFANPDQAKGVLMELAKNPHGHGSTLGQVFQSTWAGTGKHIGDTLVTVPGGTLHGMIVKTLVQAVPKIVTKTAIKTAAGYGVAKGLGAVLGPIGVGLLVAGALVKAIRKKGQNQSRAKTLNDLYQSMLNLDGGSGIVEPDGPTDKGEKGEEGGDKGQGGDDKGQGGGGTTDSGAFNDDLYNSLLNMFRFVVASNKKFGVKPDDQTNTESFKKGDKAIYKGKNVTVTVPNSSPGYTQIDGDGEGPEKKTYAVKTSDLKKALSESILSEGRYIKDKELINYLNKNVSPKRVKEFEDFMNRVEQIRNKIRNIKKTDDKVFNQKLETFKQNPIILTDFTKMFNISSTNPQAYQNFAKFINDIFSSVYGGKFKKGEMMDKLAGMGKVKADDIDEAQFQRTQIEKDAQDRGKFKKHLMQFMTDAIGLFQYMFQQRKNMGAKGGQQPQNTNKQMAKLGLTQKQRNKTSSAPTATPPSAPAAAPAAAPAPAAPTSESVENKNPLLNEEINRIKKIMSGLN